VAAGEGVWKFVHRLLYRGQGPAGEKWKTAFVSWRMAHRHRNAMNWHRAVESVSDFWPLVGIIWLVGVAVTEAVYQTARQCRNPRLSALLFLAVGVLTSTIAPAFAATGLNPVNIAVVRGPILLHPLMSFYLALRVAKAEWVPSRKSRILVAVSIVVSSWLLFGVFWFGVFL